MNSADRRGGGGGGAFFVVLELNGEYYRGFKGDGWSLDYSSYSRSPKPEDLYPHLPKDCAAEETSVEKLIFSFLLSFVVP